MSRTARLVALPFAALATITLAACGGSSSSAAPAEGCTPKHTFGTLEQGTLTVSVYVSPPYTVRQGESWGGIDGELVKKIAAMECLTLDAEPVAAAGLIASVQSKRADLAIGGVYRTEEREQTLTLSDTLYRDGMAVLSKSGVSDLAGLKGGTVGVVQGYLWNEELQKALGTDVVKIYQSSDGMINDLSNGRLDAAILTSAEAAFRVGQSPAAGLQTKEFTADPAVPSSQKPGEVVLAMTKGNAELAAAMNADIAILLGDGTVERTLTGNGMSAELAGS